MHLCNDKTNGKRQKEVQPLEKRLWRSCNCFKLVGLLIVLNYSKPLSMAMRKAQTMRLNFSRKSKAVYRRLTYYLCLLSKLQKAGGAKERAGVQFELITLLNQQKLVFRFWEINQGWPSVLLKFKSHLRESNKGALSSSSQTSLPGKRALNITTEPRCHRAFFSRHRQLLCFLPTFI